MKASGKQNETLAASSGPRLVATAARIRASFLSVVPTTATWAKPAFKHRVNIATSSPACGDRDLAGDPNLLPLQHQVDAARPSRICFSRWRGSQVPPPLLDPSCIALCWAPPAQIGQGSRGLQFAKPPVPVG